MKKVVSNFEKQNIFEAQKRMYEFVQNFEGGENRLDEFIMKEFHPYLIG